LSLWEGYSVGGQDLVLNCRKQKGEGYKRGPRGDLREQPLWGTGELLTRREAGRKLLKKKENLTGRRVKMALCYSNGKGAGGKRSCVPSAVGGKRWGGRG